MRESSIAFISRTMVLIKRFPSPTFAGLLFLVCLSLAVVLWRERDALSDSLSLWASNVHTQRVEDSTENASVIVPSGRVDEIAVSSQAQGVSPTLNRTKEPNLITENAQLEKWLRINANKKVLVVQADNRLFTPAGSARNLSSSFVHSSLVGLRLWSDMHGYAHVWVRGVPDGPNGLDVASYWNKVPATMMGFRLARRANISTVVYLDSDVVPVEFNQNETFECGLKSILNRYNTSFAVSEDVEFWSFLLSWLKLYNQQAVNSGIILFDTSAESERLLKYWWLVSTNMSSPFEVQRSALTIRFTLQETDLAQIKPFSPAPFASDIVTAKLNSTFGVRFIVNSNEPRIVDSRSAVWDLSISLFPRQDVPHGKYFLEVADRCCGKERACENLIPPGWRLSAVGDAAMTCQSAPHSTLRFWPGEQDRLNWIVTEAFPNAKVVPELGLCVGDSPYKLPDRCFQHLCNRKEKLVPEAVWHFARRRFKKLHLSDEGRTKWDQQLGISVLRKVWTLDTTTKVYDSQTDDSVFRFVEPV